jgi:hypothetical protein
MLDARGQTDFGALPATERKRPILKARVCGAARKVGSCLDSDSESRTAKTNARAWATRQIASSVRGANPACRARRGLAT